MKTIEIDEEIYSYLVSKTQEIGESASDILRRLLGLRKSKVHTLGDHELSPALTAVQFPRYGRAVDKLLYILQAVYKQKTGDFEKVLTIKGRHRKYFAKSSITTILAGSEGCSEKKPRSSQLTAPRVADPNNKSANSTTLIPINKAVITPVL